MSAEKNKTKPAAKSRIVLVDDHRTVLNGYKLMLDAEPDFVVCATATNVPEALAVIERELPDLVITDLTMAGRGGLDLIKDLAALHPGLRILVCSMHDETLYAERALRLEIVRRRDDQAGFKVLPRRWVLERTFGWPPQLPPPGQGLRVPH